MRVAAAALLPLWCGTALLLSELAWFSPTELAARLRPFSPGSVSTPRAGFLSGASFRDSLGPAAVTVSNGIARLLRSGNLSTRLAQARSTLDPAAFRVRQAGHSAAALLLTVVAVRGGSLGSVPSLVAVVVLPALAHQRLEWQLSAAVRVRQESLRRELSSFAEHLAMLIGSGWSLGPALQRMSQRGRGVVADDLRTVVARIGQGIGEGAALREWADRAGVTSLDRLVSVLELNRVTADLGRVLGAETRAMRDDQHRRLIEQLERRAEQVWIPVTVATLVPGALFLAIPFVEALRLFTAP